MEHESYGYANYNWCSWYIHQRIDTKIGGLENTEKYPGDLLSLKRLWKIIS